MSFYHDVVITSARYVGAVWSRSRNGSGVSEPAGSRTFSRGKIGPSTVGGICSSVNR
jgi:hypothetical protein